MEKSLPISIEQQAPPPARKSYIRRIASTLLVVAFTFYWTQPLIHHAIAHSHREHGAVSQSKHQCDQVVPLFPPSDNEGLDRMWDYIQTEAFKNASIIRHSGAVQIPTQTYDDMGVIGEDKRWDILFDFAKYLKATFPRIHNDLIVDTVNTHALLYTWKGSDKSLKPLVLMAHQDVVPVPDATIDAWTHPPFSGFYDGKYIWGRGSSDCKNQLIAVMETIELLLDSGWEPKRTIILSFGFDEEINGRRGGGTLAKFLIDEYGENGVAAIVDEGAGFSKAWGSVFALPGVGEKGYTDIHIVIRMPGGHSSIPSDHTSIGVASEVITAIEAEQYPTYLADESPFLGLLQCGAAHGPDFPKSLKKLLGSRHRANTCKAKPDKLALEAAKMGKAQQYLMQTSQAVDVISGGVKTNALPERTEFTVNHRINIGDTPETVWNHLTKLVKPIAKKHGLTLHAFDGTKEEAASISIWPTDTTLLVAPITPTNVDAITPYAIVAGTTRAIYGEDIIVSPGMMTGNTDTRFYWPITKHIFRFGPGYDPEAEEGLGSIHTVNERISVNNHLGMVKWFTLFVRNMDGADLA